MERPPYLTAPPGRTARMNFSIRSDAGDRGTPSSGRRARRRLVIFTPPFGDSLDPRAASAAGSRHRRRLAANA